MRIPFLGSPRSPVRSLEKRLLDSLADRLTSTPTDDFEGFLASRAEALLQRIEHAMGKAIPRSADGADAQADLLRSVAAVQDFPDEDEDDIVGEGRDD